VHRRLKVIIPTVQILAVVGVLVWERMAGTDRMLTDYALPTRQMITNLNLPLVAFWWPFIPVMERFGNYLPFPMVMGLALAMMAFASIGLFWYFVVAEVQLRMRGKSLLRFPNRVVESVKVFILFFCGIGTFFHAYTEAIRPSQHGLARYGLWPVEIALTVVFLAIWGSTFIGISISDFRKWLMTMRKSGTQPGGSKS